MRFVGVGRYADSFRPVLRRGLPCDPDNSSGQWQYIPENYCTEHDLDFMVACSCKKADCLRKCGLKQEKQQAGRKRAATTGGGVSPITIDVEEKLPRPPIIVSIDQIWAERCAPPPEPVPRVPVHTPCLRAALARDRCARLTGVRTSTK